MAKLFDTYEMKGLTLKNRIVMPPMCCYMIDKKDGVATDWHYVHYVSRAIGGAGLIIIEMTNIEPNGRISDKCMGLWDDAQIEPLKRIVDAVHAYGAKVAIQIAHAGRKAEDAPHPIAPSAIAFDEKYKTPRALETDEIPTVINQFKEAVGRALKAGVDAIEIHGAHGYLIHQFHSAYTNKRTDAYGDDLTKFGCDILKTVKAIMPKDMPLMMRISACEYVDGGYGIDQGIELARAYVRAGADVIDVSSGGEGPFGSRGGPGMHAAYQVPMARRIKEALNVPVIAVGRLDDPEIAAAVIGNEEADLVAIGRGMLKNPNWSYVAAQQLGVKVEKPSQLDVAF